MHGADPRVLEHWGEFYLLLGTAAAALVALLVVAASVGVGFLTRERTGPTRTYMSPVVVHFTSVLFISAMSLIPSQTRFSLALLIGLNAIGAIIYSIFIAARLLRDDIADLADRLAYGAGPLLSYAAALTAAALLLRGAEWAPEVLAGAVILLLIVNIRNAWDLTLAMVRRGVPKPPE